MHSLVQLRIWPAAQNSVRARHMEQATLPRCPAPATHVHEVRPAVEVLLSAGHAAHRPPALPPKEPATQGTHGEAPRRLDLPAGHAVQASVCFHVVLPTTFAPPLPLTACVEPGGQAAHLASRVTRQRDGVRSSSLES